MNPLDYVEAVEKNFNKENNSANTVYITAKLNNILRNMTPSLEARLEMRGRLNKIYKERLASIKNFEEEAPVIPLVTLEYLWTLNGADMKEHAFKWLEAKKITFENGIEIPLAKDARYIIIKKGFACDFISAEEKERMYQAEKNTDYNIEDDYHYFGCEVMLPENREKLWNDYVEGTRFNIEQMRYTATGFMTWRNEEVTGKYADKFMAVIEQIFAEKHRDYAEVFFVSLSPAFLNRPQDLESFKAIYERAMKTENTHFQKLLKREI